MTNFNTHGQDLDGKGKIVPTAFDAYEQVAHVQHEAAPLKKDYAHSGLQVVDADDAVTEYPKAVDHVDHPSGVGKQPVIVNSAEEEAAHEDAKNKTVLYVDREANDVLDAKVETKKSE